jgi:hypothetical protein
MALQILGLSACNLKKLFLGDVARVVGGPLPTDDRRRSRLRLATRQRLAAALLAGEAVQEEHRK